MVHHIIQAHFRPSRHISFAEIHIYARWRIRCFRAQQIPNKILLFRICELLLLRSARPVVIARVRLRSTNSNFGGHQV